MVPDLDSLPPIPYELFPMEYYRLMRMPHAQATDFVFQLCQQGVVLLNVLFAIEWIQVIEKENQVHYWMK